MHDAFKEWFASLPLQSGSRAWANEKAVAAVVRRDDDSGDGFVIRAVARDGQPFLEVVHHEAATFEQAKDEIEILYHE
ncbi:MAG: hypothetical protein PVI57_02880 [Gemmatimonadota bacterium]|jgi:hypothetical protein